MSPSDAQRGPVAGTSGPGAPLSLRPSVSSVRLGSLPASSEQALRLIQDRLGLFAVSVFGISAMFLVAMLALDLGLADGQGFQSPAGHLWHVVATLAAFATWRVARQRRLLSPAALTLLDGLGTVGPCVAFALMGSFLQQPFGFYTALLAIVHVNVGRAAIVPSVATRTLAMSAPIR